MPYKSKEALKERNQRYYREHKVEIIENAGKYQRSEAGKAKRRKWLKRNRTRLVSKKREYNAEHRDEINAKQRDSGDYRKLREQIFDLLGRQCRNCDFADVRALQFDHLNGDGAEHRKVRSGTANLKWILENLEQMQVLCCNCNWIKRVENNEIGGRPRS